jgi:hypothetical protein
MRILVGRILVLLLLLWIGISVVRTFYNASKLVTEERKWYFLSDEQKRALEFGDPHYFLRFVQAHTKEGSNILFFTDDSQTYYLSRYYLYPTKRMGRPESFLWNAKNISYDYYMIYPANHMQLLKEPASRPDVNKFKKIATYHGKNGEIGIIYKK